MESILVQALNEEVDLGFIQEGLANRKCFMIAGGVERLEFQDDHFG